MPRKEKAADPQWGSKKKSLKKWCVGAHRRGNNLQDRGEDHCFGARGKRKKGRLNLSAVGVESRGVLLHRWGRGSMKEKTRCTKAGSCEINGYN